MAELLETGAALRQAQQDSLAGQPGAARQLRSTSAQLRAETLLIRAGHAASVTLVDTRSLPRGRFAPWSRPADACTTSATS